MNAELFQYFNNGYTGMGLPWRLMVKDPPANAGDVGLIPGSGRCPGEGNGYPLLYSCLENSRDRGAWWATVHGVGTTEQLTLWGLPR